MRRRTWRGWVVATAVVVGIVVTGESAHAAGWASAFLGESQHDFGAVPRGAKVRHNFVVSNRLDEPVSILDVRASCGCTTGRASTSVIPPGGTATIEAEMDTRNFVGRKATVLTVTFVSAAGRQDEVRLGVASTILSDIVLNPGTIDFGTVGRGQPAVQTLTIDRIGPPSWRIERMLSGCRAIDASLVETARNGQRVSYLLKVSVKPEAPAGLVRDEIRLVTNDKEAPVFPVQVTALIRGDLTSSPAVLSLGKVASAAVVQGRFLVRSSKPFTVRNIEGAGEGFEVSVDDPGPKPVHIIAVNFRPERATIRGDLRRVFRLHTDLVGESPLDLTATLHVDP